MELNSFLFPAPQSSYTVHAAIGDLLFIPRMKKDASVTMNSVIDEDRSCSAKQSNEDAATSNKEQPIPCLYLPYAQGSSKLMIYFHGNAEDIGLACELLDYIRSLLKVHVLAVEYPGYGIYHGTPDAEQILQDAESVYDYLTKNGEPWAIPESSIILFGRSIGTGPATHLAANRRPCSLLLMSPFKSIREIVREQAGSLLQYIISDRFRNIDEIEKVRCPTFIVHGQRDTLISFRHSQELHYKCGGPSALIMPRDMDHNEFDFIDDLIQPFHQFLKQCKIEVEITPVPKKGRKCREPAFDTDNIVTVDDAESSHHSDQGDSGFFRFPEHLYSPPANFPRQNQNGTMWNWLLRKFM